MYKFIFVVKLGALSRKFIWQLYKKARRKYRNRFSPRGVKVLNSGYRLKRKVLIS